MVKSSPLEILFTRSIVDLMQKPEQDRSSTSPFAPVLAESILLNEEKEIPSTLTTLTRKLCGIEGGERRRG